MGSRRCARPGRRTVAVDAVDLNHLSWHRPTLVLDAKPDVPVHVLKIRLGDLLQRRRTVGGHRPPQAAGPGPQQQRAVVGVVIGVVMGDEDGPEVDDG